MSQEKIDKAIAERKSIQEQNKALAVSRKWHQQKFEEHLKTAQEYAEKVKGIDAEISENNKRFFNKGTELEELTGTKRIEFLK